MGLHDAVTPRRDRAAGQPRPLAQRTVALAARLGASSEALSLRGRLARVALEAAGIDDGLLGELLGAGSPRPESAARVALATPGRSCPLPGLLAMDLREICAILDDAAWALGHVLPPALIEALGELQAAAGQDFPVAALSLERAGLAVRGAWDGLPRDPVYWAGALGRHAERARLVAWLCWMAEERSSIGVWAVARAAASDCELHSGWAPADEARSALLSDPTRPFSLAFCLSRIQEASGRLGMDAGWSIPVGWAELARAGSAAFTRDGLQAIEEALRSVEAPLLEELGPALLAIQRAEPGSGGGALAQQ